MFCLVRLTAEGVTRMGFNEIQKSSGVEIFQKFLVVSRTT